MKKTLTIIAALALALGMTQCKKAEVPQATTDEGIFVTFTASYGGERTSFDPTGCSFTWNTSGTEYIYVGCEGMSGCIGELSAPGNGSSNLTFTGTLNSTPANGATLHFFYLGNGRHENTTTLDFSNQDGTHDNLTNYHIAVGSQTYTTGMTNFSATLNPLVAFARFDLSAFGTEAVSISGDGVYSTATIDYQKGEIAGNTKGSVSVGTPLSGGNYVALIPSTSVSSTDYATTLEFGNTGYSGSLEFKRGIFAGRYYTTANGGALEVEAISAAPSHEYVDLGLTSGTLWATCNVGADTPEGYGSYFAWGETELKNTYTWKTYQYCYYMVTNKKLTKYCNNSSLGYSGFTDNLTTLVAGDDAATAKWGGNWRMPTQEEWQELFHNTTVTLETRNGVNGCLLTANNGSGNSIFLPAAGFRLNNAFQFTGEYGFYWSSSLYTEDAYCALQYFFNLDDEMDYLDNSDRCYGMSIRAVQANVSK